MAKTHSLAAFNESVDLVLRLNVDPKHGDQLIRGTCTLPHSLGKKTRVAVLTEPENLDKAKNADKILTKEDLELIKDNKLKFTKIICTTNSLNLLKPLAR